MGKYVVIPADAIQITEDQRAMARAFYVKQTGKSQRGATSDAMIDAWFEAGSPEMLIESSVKTVKFADGDLRKFRAWLSDNGIDFRSLSAEDKETKRNEWEELGKPVPDSFMDRDVVARVFALPIVDGKIDSNAGTVTFEITREELRDVRGVKPGAPTVAEYLEAIGDKLEGYSVVRIVNSKGTEHRATDSGEWGVVRATTNKVLEEKDREMAKKDAQIAELMAAVAALSAKIG